MNSALSGGGWTTEAGRFGRTTTTRAENTDDRTELFPNSLSNEDNPSGRSVRVVIRGDIDNETAPQLGTAINGLIDGGATLLLLDASAITFLDSSGLRAIIRAGNRMTEVGGYVVIEGMSGAVRRVLEVSGLIEKYRRT